MVLAALLLLPVAACANGDTESEPTAVETLRVASFDFDESRILAEVYAQAVERAGVPVTRLGAVGPREIVIPAMRSDQIDLVAEYLGSALRFAEVLEAPDDPTVAAELLALRVDAFGIDVLTPSSAEDSNVFVVSDATAERLELDAVSDLATAGLTRFGGPAECPDRPLCLVGLRDTYGVSFDEFVAQPSLAFTAEALRRDEIDVGLLFSTSPQLDAPDLFELTDDLGLQPPENVVPLLRRSALERWGPELVRALDAVSAQLTTPDLRRLNGLIADGVSPSDAAREWLASFE